MIIAELRSFLKAGTKLANEGRKTLRAWRKGRLGTPSHAPSTSAPAMALAPPPPPASSTAPARREWDPDDPLYAFKDLVEANERAARELEAEAQKWEADLPPEARAADKPRPPYQPPRAGERPPPPPRPTSAPIQPTESWTVVPPAAAPVPSRAARLAQAVRHDAQQRRAAAKLTSEPAQQ